MNQAEFNKIDGKKLLSLLARHPDTAAAQEAAVAVLGADARAWWQNRQASPIGRLVDEATGKWQTPFTANGRKYHITTVAEGLTPRRYTEMKKILSVVGFQATYADQLAALNRITQAANSLVTKEPKLDVLFTEIQNMRAAIRQTDNLNWDYSFYAATLFINREGEDVKEWSESLANEKIADWQAEGLNAFDFFLLAMLYASQLTDEWRRLPEIVRRLNPKSLFK